MLKKKENNDVLFVEGETYDCEYEGVNLICRQKDEKEITPTIPDTYICSPAIPPPTTRTIDFPPGVTKEEIEAREFQEYSRRKTRRVVLFFGFPSLLTLVISWFISPVFFELVLLFWFLFLLVVAYLIIRQARNDDQKMKKKEKGRKIPKAWN